MNKPWSSDLSYNSYLRSSAKANNSMTMELLSPGEQQQALEAILKYVLLMKSGKEAKSCHMTIKLHFGDSERSHC